MKLSTAKLFSFLSITLLCTACNKTPEEVIPTTNPEIEVQRLFTHDNCTIYKFKDGGANHYFTKCKDAKSETLTLQPCGKGCMRNEVISNR